MSRPSARLDATDRDDEEDLLGRVRGRRDGVGGEDRERDGLRDALVLQLRRGQRPTDEYALDECHVVGSSRSPCARPAADSLPFRAPSITDPHAGPGPSRQRCVSDSNRPRTTDSLLRPDGRREVPCTSSSSDAAGWAASSPLRLERSGHTVAVIDKNADCVPAAARRLHRPEGRRLRLRPRPPRSRPASSRPAPSPRSPAATTPTSSRARIARENYAHRARRRPHLRPAAGADLPAPRHPDRRHRRVDHRPGAAPAPARRGAAARLGRPERQGLPRRLPDPGRSGRARSSRRSSEPGRVLARRRHPLRARRRSCTPSAIGQDGDVLHFVADVAALDDAARSARARRGAPLMRVAIAGAGNVGLFIANDLRARRPRGACSSSRTPRSSKRSDGRRRHRVARRRRVRGRRRCARPGSTLRRRGRRDRRRRGQPRDLAARQAGVRRAARHRAGEPPEERVAVQRELGRRPLGVDPAPHHRARRGGRDGRPPRAHPPVRRRSGPAGRGHAGRRLAGHRPRDQATSTSRATRRSSRSCATSTS